MNYLNIELNDFSLPELQLLAGINDENLEALRTLHQTDLLLRDNILKVESLDADSDKFILAHLKLILSLLKERHSLTKEDIKNSYAALKTQKAAAYLAYSKKIIAYNYENQAIRVKTAGQAELIMAIEDNDIVFVKGPAGTGKTFLAVLMAVNAWKKNEVKRIVLTRPAVEAGESLGFLPGDLKEKVDPYLMPLYDALYDILGKERSESLIARGVIEIIPLAYMRGRTLNDSFVILDEAQNTTAKQMFMFLTRLGQHSEMVVTGDITQIDLELHGKTNGLSDAMQKLQDIPRIKAVTLTKDDIVRNPLVQTIIEHYL